MTKEVEAPDITEQGNDEGNDQDDHALFEEDTGGGGLKGKGVNGPLDDQRDQ